MCGICGNITWRMNSALEHHESDGEGEYINARLVMVRRGLNTINLKIGWKCLLITIISINAKIESHVCYTIPCRSY